MTVPTAPFRRAAASGLYYVFLEATVGTAPSKHRAAGYPLSWPSRLCRPRRNRSVSRLVIGVQNARHFPLQYLLLFASRAGGGKRHSFSPVAPVCYRPTRSMHSSSTFRRRSLCPLRPHSAISGANLCRTPLLISAAGAHEGDGAMEITIHKHLIEQCVMMACASKADRDKALWLTMAQSWGRLADEVERSGTVLDHKALFQTDRRYHRG